MKLKKLHWILLIGLAITVIGLVTGQYFFLLLILPLGFGFSGGGKKEDKD